MILFNMGNVNTIRRASRRKFKQLLTIWKGQGLTPRCVYCGLHNFTEANVLTHDHIIPVSKGGNQKKDNLVPCCLFCNRRKGTDLWAIKYNKFLDK